MDLQTATPAEIDTQLAEIYRRAASPKSQAEHYASAAVDARHPRYGRPDETLAAKYEALAEKAAEQFRAIMAECAPFDGEFDRRGGWTRAFIVTDGHVHSSMSCHTCYPTTQFGWLPQVSGQTEAEIVAQAGEGACTVCYPTAPVVAKGTRTLFHADEIAKQAARVEREAKRAAAAAKKAEKAIVATDGTPLRVFDYHYAEHTDRRGRLVAAYDKFETLETASRAKQWLTDTQEEWRSQERTRAEDVKAVSEALAMKFGTTPEQELADAKKRASKRR